MKIVVAGQVYLNPKINEYLVITKTNQDQVSWRGVGFRGTAVSEVFLEEYQPVDPQDLDDAERKSLVSFYNGELLMGCIEND